MPALSAPEIIKILKQKGYKNSELRNQVLDYIFELKKMFSARDILEYLSTQKLYPNKTTIYRELEMLVTERILEEINLTGNKLYEVNSAEIGHHHHLICNNCETIKCVQVCEDLQSIETEITQKAGFQIEKHLMEFFGKCAQCQKLNTVN